MQAPIPDEEIIQQVLHGNTAAFAVLVQRYQSLVFTIALRIVARREEAEETAQDVFMRVYNNLANFKGDARFSSWLYRIAHNTALNKLKTAGKDVLMAQMPDTATIHNQAEQTFNAEYVNTAIASLNAEDATIITLFYLSENSLDEIAEVLNIDANAAKVRLHRARKKLREKLAPVS
jgi:RNA polymerase sigma factor (sigma-70 family)